MLQNERHRKILNQLKVKHAVKVTELAKEMGISESTIRRDINELDQMGKLKKVFGGAVSLSRETVSTEADVASRNLINTEEKECIARYAASLIGDNGCRNNDRKDHRLSGKEKCYICDQWNHPCQEADSEGVFCIYDRRTASAVYRSGCRDSCH